MKHNRILIATSMVLACVNVRAELILDMPIPPPLPMPQVHPTAPVVPLSEQISYPKPDIKRLNEPEALAAPAGNAFGGAPAIAPTTGTDQSDSSSAALPDAFDSHSQAVVAGSPNESLPEPIETITLDGFLAWTLPAGFSVTLQPGINKNILVPKYTQHPISENWPAKLVEILEPLGLFYTQVENHVSIYKKQPVELGRYPQ